MAVGRNFLYIQFCAYGNVCHKGDIAVFVAIGDFKQSVLRNDRAVCGGQILGSVQPELHRENFAAIPDIKGFVLAEHFGKGQSCLLALVIELGGCFGDFDGFARIGQLDGLGRTVQHHAIGCFCFSDGILAEVQWLAFCCAVFVCGQRINDHTLGIA